MNRSWKQYRWLSLVALAAWAAPVSAQQPKCSQDHPGKQHRIESVAKRKDTRMTLSVAGHVVKYAIQRFNLAGLVSQGDIDRVISIKGETGSGEMYNFLKWKLGGPGAVAGQFVTAGYEHFDKAYSDEAAGMLLGLISFAKTEPELVMPAWMQTYLKAQAGQSGQAISVYLQGQGVPAPLADAIGSKVSEQLTKAVQRNVAAFIPKSYDVDNRIVAAALKARRGV